MLWQLVYWQLGLICPSVVWALLGQDLKPRTSSRLVLLLRHAVQGVWCGLSTPVVWTARCFPAPCQLQAPVSSQPLVVLCPVLSSSSLHVCSLLFKDSEEGCAELWAFSSALRPPSVLTDTSGAQLQPLFPPPLETTALCWGSAYLRWFGNCSGQEAGVELSIMCTFGQVQ